jgi:phage shock protein A
MDVEEEIKKLKKEVAKLNKRIDELKRKKNDVSASNAPAPSGVPVIRIP